ncbi:hypothetical protein E2C01_037174 [Portunus trituberculatus]|uniref:Uncharacterized protein n=1 Tax=Portunus trituberculatus TaxID=210409 RepID=A0A5B7FDG2_PORTR|nr:hypothetical protein [Portunus trituberculatus]
MSGGRRDEERTRGWRPLGSTRPALCPRQIGDVHIHNSTLYDVRGGDNVAVEKGEERPAVVRLVACCGGGRQMAGRRWRAVVTARSGSPAGARASTEWRPPLCEPPRVFLVRATRAKGVATTAGINSNTASTMSLRSLHRRISGAEGGGSDGSIQREREARVQRRITGHQGRLVGDYKAPTPSSLPSIHPSQYEVTSASHRQVWLCIINTSLRPLSKGAKAPSTSHAPCRRLTLIHGIPISDYTSPSITNTSFSHASPLLSSNTP